MFKTIPQINFKNGEDLERPALNTTTIIETILIALKGVVICLREAVNCFQMSLIIRISAV